MNTAVLPTLVESLSNEREQTPGEELANALSHGLGCLMAIGALPLLVSRAVRDGSTGDVVVSDGTRTDTQSLSISVTDQNEAPRIVSNGGGTTAALTVDDGQTAVTQVLVNDVDAGTTIRYTLGGADAAKFRIDAATGALAFIAAPDREQATDAGAVAGGFGEDRCNFFTR